MSFDICWDNQKNSFFKYGGEISYGEGGQVSFRHGLLSPGVEVVSWSSSVPYFESRSPLELPLLERGQRYGLNFSGAVHPEGSLLLKVEFFDRVSSPVGHCFLNLGAATFLYPKDAYSYKISLLSTGLEHLHFEGLRLSRAED